jgi:MFS family permease
MHSRSAASCFWAGAPVTCSAGAASFMAGLLLFSVASLLCGLSVSPAMLIALRVAQGAAEAVLSPSVFSIVSVTIEEGSERNKALGLLERSPAPGPRSARCSAAC